MLGPLLLMYGSVLLGAFLPTVLLIFSGRSWGQLPFVYLRIVSWLQSLFPPMYPHSEEEWPATIHKEQGVRLEKATDSSSASFAFLQQKKELFDIALDLTQSGLEAVVQDDISTAFARAPTFVEPLLRFSPLPQWTLLQKTVFYLCLAFRLFLLFPVRMALFISSFVFVSLACVVSFITTLTAQQKTWIAIVYCRLFNAGFGLVAEYHKKENIPKRPGIAVANHMTPNDIQIIFAGTESGAEYGYMVTGQKHTGIIGAIEALVSRLCPSLWLERKSAQERSDFLSEVLKTARNGGVPILIFPEGYCTNNTQVIQFRKAVFEPDLDIYPVAIKQEARYGDSYWFEDEFHIYVLRMMLSWAVRYDVTYLPPVRRYEGETNGLFAARVQGLIAKTAGLQQGRFDGGFWYKRPERQRILDEQRRLVALSLGEEESESESSCSGTDDSFCVLPKPCSLLPSQQHEIIVNSSG